MVLKCAIAFSWTAVVATREFMFASGGIHTTPRSFPEFASVYKEEHAIVIYHPFSNCYGHIVNELMPAYLSIPSEIWAISVLYVPSIILKHVVTGLLDLCGKKPRAVKNLWRCVFARYLYVPNPWLFMKISPDAVRAMRNRIISRLGLQSLIPVNSVIGQRSRNRIIRNVEPLFTAILKKYPKENWLIFYDKKRTMAEQISFHANITMLIIASGSGGANTVWMKPNTVFIEIQHRGCVSALLDVARAVGAKVFETTSVEGNWKFLTVDVDLMLAIIERGYQFMRSHSPGEKS
jgi:hypothetical protein